MFKIIVNGKQIEAEYRSVVVGYRYGGLIYERRLTASLIDMIDAFGGTHTQTPNSTNTRFTFEASIRNETNSIDFNLNDWSYTANGGPSQSMSELHGIPYNRPNVEGELNSNWQGTSNIPFDFYVAVDYFMRIMCLNGFNEDDLLVAYDYYDTTEWSQSGAFGGEATVRYYNAKGEEIGKETFYGHLGSDIVPQNGEDSPFIRAAFAGTVVRAIDNRSTGNGVMVTIKHNINGKIFYSSYSHMKLNSIVVKDEQTVSAGQVLGKMGSTGVGSGRHLHLAFYVNTSSSSTSSSSPYGYYGENFTETEDYRDYSGWRFFNPKKVIESNAMHVYKNYPPNLA